MKKIINGTRYDTEKAVLVGEASFGAYPANGDFSHWKAALYKTPRSGRFFLVGEGGAMTQFAEHCADGSRCGGTKLIPMTQDDALAWAEKYLDVEEVEKHFEDMIEDA